MISMAIELYNRLAGNLNFEEDLNLMRTKAEALLARVADISTEVTNAELHPAKKRKREVDNWMKNAQELHIRINCIEEEVEQDDPSSRQRLKNQILQIIKDIDELLQQATFSNGLVIHDLASSSLPLLTTQMKGQQFEDNLRMILSWLKADEVSRIGVYGIGGVGKTTLATHIHNQLLHDLGKYACVCWVTVSQDCTISKLQDKIVKALDQPGILEGVDEMKRPAILSEAFKKRRNVVIILDDMWNHLPAEKVGFPTGENGCKLLLTTRSSDVCRRMNCQRSVKVQTLSEEESWNLFAEVLGNYNELSQDAKVIAKLVAKECDGLPLGIKVVAASMTGVLDVYEWNNTLEELKNPTRIHEEMENEVFPSLKLSYSRLNDVVLQKCFLSCALYPEDYKLEKDKLVDLWIMEGHLEGIQSRQKQLDKAHSMLNRLVSACLLDAAYISFTRANIFMMHDLIRDMAVRISSQSNCVMIKAGMQLREVPRLQEWTEELTKVSLVHNKIHEIPVGMKPICPNLSCLLLEGNPLLTIPNSFLMGFRGIKFLDLSLSSIESLPNCVANLKSLSAINLFACRSLTHVPSLAKLTKLRHLNLSSCSEICSLPEGMEKLVNLECLFLRDSWRLFVSFGKLTSGLLNIQCLELNSCVKDVTTADILKLGCLERLTNCHMHDIDNFNTYVQSQHFLQLTSYQILLGTSGHCGRFHNMCVILLGIRFEDGEEPPQLPHNIQELEVCRCAFLVSSLTDALPSLDGLTSLKSIEIARSGKKGLECIWSESSCARPTLESLEQLILIDLNNFSALAKGRVELPPRAFSSLKTLSMELCHMVEKLFTPCLLNGQLRNLEEIKVTKCDALKEIFAGSGLDDESGDATVEVSRINTMISVGLPKLRVLHLSHLPRLVCICNTTLLRWKSIEEITVRDCPELKKPPLVDEVLELSPPPRLKNIHVGREWWGSLVWDYPRNKQTLEPFLKFF